MSTLMGGRTQIWIIVALIFLLETTTITASSSAKTKVDHLIKNICETLHEDGSLYLNENEQWETLCREYFKSTHFKQQNGKQKEEEEEDDENADVETEKDMTPIIKLRKGGFGGFRGGGGFRSGGGFRFGSGGSRSSGIRSSSSSGSRSSSSFSRYRSIRTGASISHPTGWLWSRSRYTFLPLATMHSYRSHSSSNRYTIPPTNSTAYYYCTASHNVSTEIQCNSINGDTKCCEDERSHEVFCCGGKIADDLVKDFNRATLKFAQIFYTLAALALFMHVIMRRFYW